MKSRHSRELIELRDQLRRDHEDEVRELKSLGYGESFKLKEELLHK